MELSGDVAPFELPKETIAAYDLEMVDYNEKMEVFLAENATYTEEMQEYDLLKAAYDE